MGMGTVLTGSLHRLHLTWARIGCTSLLCVTRYVRRQVPYDIRQGCSMGVAKSPHGRRSCSASLPVERENKRFLALWGAGRHGGGTVVSPVPCSHTPLAIPCQCIAYQRHMDGRRTVTPRPVGGY